MFGQSEKRPVSGRAAQPPEPPAQLLKPEPISAQTHWVPRIAPYPCGQGSGLPSASDGQVPLA